MANTSEKSPKVAKKAAAKQVATKPALLSGGNPQISKADGDAPVQAYIASMPGWKRDRRAPPRRTHRAHRPRSAQSSQMELAALRGRGPGWFLGMHCFTNYVKLAFFRGTSLRPVPPRASKSKDTRYLDIHEDDQLDEAQFADWVKQASQLPGQEM
jgi:hypothetical protein